MQTLAKSFVRRAAGPVAAAAAGATCAHARAPAAVAVGAAGVRPPVAKLEEEWVITHVNGNQVLFQPYGADEIDAGVEELGALFRPIYGSPAVVISEVSPDGSVCTDGMSADGIIESADGRRGSATAAFSAGGGLQQEQLDTLLQITSKMLRRPGLQREVVACMMEDPAVRDLMLTQCDNLDVYLTAAGFPAPASGLLMPGEESHAEAAAPPGPDLISSVINAVSSLLERTGGALAFLGHWLRDRFAFLGRPMGEGGAPTGSTATADKVMGSVMMLAVAVVCMLVVKKPMRLRFA